jgi:serine protein kinase
MCKQDKSCYASAAERLLTAIGEPEMIDTSTNPRLSRLFSNRVVARYPAFKDFGMEEAIEQIVSYLKHSAQGLEEKKQILYLLGPVGGGKSSLAEKLKSLMQKVPLRIKGSPVNDHPFCRLTSKKMAKSWRRVRHPAPLSAPHHVSLGRQAPARVWRRHHQVQGGEGQPSILDQIAIAKTEPGDDNNQDISSLVGKVDIRMLEHFAQDDADAYSYSGALCKANQG